MIPHRLVRTIPAKTSDQVETWWREACTLHPGWEHVTIREPVDPKQFPLTGHLFDSCESGAQKADLIRAEDLWSRGGLYVDADVQVFRSFEPLLPLKGFAAWEDEHHVCNALLGFQPGHPALKRVIELAIQRHEQGTWQAGVGVVTQVLRDAKDVLLLPPQCFYAVHWRNRAHLHRHRPDPWEFAAHHWAHSWKDSARV